MATNISETVMNVLQKQDKPLAIDEIAFRARSTPSAIHDILDRFKKASIVKETDDNKYQLNEQNDFDLLKMY